MRDRDRSSSGIVELRNQTQQSRVIQVDLERLQPPSGILRVRTNAKYWVVDEGQRINPARVLWSCATRHISWESSKSIWKDCSNFRVFSGYAQTQNTKCRWSRLGYYGVAQLDTPVQSRPSRFRKTTPHLPHTPALPLHFIYYLSTTYHSCILHHVFYWQPILSRPSQLPWFNQKQRYWTPGCMLLLPNPESSKSTSQTPSHPSLLRRHKYRRPIIKIKFVATKCRVVQVDLHDSMTAQILNTSLKLSTIYEWVRVTAIKLRHKPNINITYAPLGFGPDFLDGYKPQELNPNLNPNPNPNLKFGLRVGFMGNIYRKGGQVMVGFRC